MSTSAARHACSTAGTARGPCGPETVVVDLTPVVDGYWANLARTFLLGEPDARQRSLPEAYEGLIPVVRDAMRPGATVAQLDGHAGAVLREHGLAQHQVQGIGHGLGLRFEETPASTIIPPHRNIPLLDGMTVTIGHTILAIPGFGGVRHEDVYRATPAGGGILVPYPFLPWSPPPPPTRSIEPSTGPKQPHRR